MTKDTARTLARIAQASAVALAGAAVGVAALGPPAGNAAPSTDGASTGGEIPTPAPAVRLPAADADTIGIAERLALLDNAPRVAQDEPPADEPTVVEEPTPEPTASERIADRVRYLGPITVGRTLLAMVRVDDAQRVVRPGAVLIADEDASRVVTLRSVSEGAIEVGTGPSGGQAGGQSGSLERIERGGPVGTSVTLAAGGTVTPPPPGMSLRPGNARDEIDKLAGDQPRQAIERPTDLATVVDERRLREEQRLQDLISGGTLTPEQQGRIQSRLDRMRAMRASGEGEGGD